MMSRTSATAALKSLARLYDVQTAYYDVNSNRKTASVESLLGVLKAMGVPIETPDDAPSAIREHELSRWRRPLESVSVNWEGGRTLLEMRIPERLADINLVGHLRLEGGECERLEWYVGDLRTLEKQVVDGHRYVVKQLPIEGPLPFGYHKLTVDIPGRPTETLIISSPTKSYSPNEEWECKGWGVFLPLYALYTQKGSGTGTFSDLERLTDWVTSKGGSVVATLPMLAAFLDEPFDPSPYSPVSRLMWNEFYIDFDRVPEMRGCASAQSLLDSSAYNDESAVLRDDPLVDYKREMDLKRRVLEELAHKCLRDSTERGADLQKFLRQNPTVADYATFRAALEKQGKPWSQWPDAMRDGVLQSGDYDEESKNYHAYVQWLAHDQMKVLSHKADEEGAGLYLDLPLGVHPDGYDVWKNQGLFASGTRVGSPPDTFFTRGQDWGFPPIHPEKSREQGHKYWADVFRNHFSHAGILRIDHVMGLHRLYWIPEGVDAQNAAYVRYPAEELYAILCLESHRQRCWVIGENLGTVPTYVNQAMSRHGLGKLYVAQFELKPDPEKALNPVTANTVASFNTHDMPPFASYWNGNDISNRLETGLLNNQEAEAERRELDKIKKALEVFLKDKGLLDAESTPEAIYSACMAYLSTKASHLLLLNLEDLWLEDKPQNVPGTGPERPNWRRKARYSLDDFVKLPRVLDVLAKVDQLR